MIVLPILKLSFAALWANKLRTGLTFLGVVVGFTSVMTIISALEGMMGAIEEDLSALGPSTFIVQKWGMAMSHEEALEMSKRRALDVKVGDLIEDGCDLCEIIASRSGAGALVKYGNEDIRDVYISGATSNYIDIVDIEVAQGRYHALEDDLHRKRVALIGDDIREKFFSGVDPLGKTIRIDGTRYTVIGVAKRRGSMFGDSQDEFVVIPFSAHLRQFGNPRGRMSLVIKARSIEDMDDAKDQVRMVLRAQRHVPPSKPDDFAILTADNILEMLNNITRIFRMGLIGISSISVIVGGIVVMNIMMVSVTERTREIGIRKAVGARRRHILLQFLFESLITTLTGGLVGIIAGFLTARMLVGMIDMNIEPSTLAIVAGLSISIGIGLIFGIYPAMKAARLDPIKALSYE
jgi:putative ABC transport system permease protein